MIYEWARLQANKNPDKIAVTLNGSHLSYGKLESASNQLAGKLLASGLKTGARVGLLMGKTPDAIIAMHGINKAGGVYVSIDINNPREQISRILDASQVSFLIVDKQALPKYLSVIENDQDKIDIPWIWWSKDRCKPQGQKKFSFSYEEIEEQAPYPYQKIKDEDFPAQIIFSNDSVEKPKGVVVTHKNITNFIRWSVSYFDVEPHDRLSGHAPFHSELSSFDIYCTMAAGAHLYIVPEHLQIMPKQLSSFILENDITQWFSEPSALNYIAGFDAIPDGGYPGLKRLIWSGEDFSTSSIKYWMKKLPDVDFTNVYGFAEATIASCYYTLSEIPQASEDIPIGTPCSGEKIFILDEEMNPVQEGEIGDLYIAGKGLSPGYWNDENATEQAYFFYLNTKGEQERIYKTGDLASCGMDGLIYFHGRSERQPNVESETDLITIESALSKEKKLREYAVIPLRNNSCGKTAIGCAYVPTGSENGEMPPLLKANLLKAVPNHLVPKYWKCFDKLPRNGNGKIDKKLLAEAFKS